MRNLATAETVERCNLPTYTSLNMPDKVV